jgi:hypothetical protein
MTTSPEESDNTESQAQDDLPVTPDDPMVDPTDAGFPSSPDLDDDNTVVTAPNPDPEPGASAG